MSLRTAFKLSIACAGAILILCPTRVLGCAACFGKSDSSLARGMNMGILSLLGMVFVMLSTVAAFFVFLARRSARTASRLEGEKAPETVIQS
jgi:hypothetical protein